MKNVCVMRAKETRSCELLIFLVYAIYHGLRNLRRYNAYKQLDPSSVLIEPFGRTTGSRYCNGYTGNLSNAYRPFNRTDWIHTWKNVVNWFLSPTLPIYR
ncbi:unnamed protein product [Xylocopa violacea]|uniref:Uncharacterized protein n=1 Tax=Xylocopa violacea TaxID=135666 RepID=A0ABP1P857_XYLVO